MKQHLKTLLSASRSLTAPVTNIGTVHVVLILVFAIVVIYYLFPRAQSFTVVASTQSVTITFAEGAQDVWSLQNATLCQRLPDDVTATSNDADEPRCDPATYTELTALGIDILWTPGYRVTVSGHDEAQLVASISAPEDGAVTFFDDEPVRHNSVLFFDRAGIANLGGLIAHGEVEIGELAEAGAAKLTRAGTYQIRETLPFPTRKTLVASGEILTGDLVRLTDNKSGGIRATMLLTQTSEPLADFDILMTSPERPSAIEITRVGGAQSTISTRTTDRIANDPLPVAVSIFLGLLGVTLGIARSLTPAKPPLA